MPEHLRALIVILALAVPVLWIAQRVLCPAVIETADFVRRRNLWLGLTLAAFLSHNHWLFLVISAALVLWAANPVRERNPLALFFFVLFALPELSSLLPGFGILEHLFEITHIRLLALLVLLPTALRLRADPTVAPMGRFWTDWFLLAYVLLQAVVYFGAIPLTQAMRATFYLGVDVLLVYYVASRSVSDLAGLRDALASLCVSLLVIAPIAVFEFAKYWLLYASLSVALGLNPDPFQYLGRESLLRATGPAGHSLVLGYSLAVALGLWFSLQGSLRPLAWWAGALALAIGLIAPVSRAPWVGGILIVAVAVATGRNASPRLLKLFVASTCAVVIIAFSPYGERIAQFIPFVGTVDEFNVTYRARLFEVSIMVISLNPLFGSPNFLSNPLMEQMRQGQGIIDLVNSYIGIALFSGVVGLSLFLAFFGTSLVELIKAVRTSRRLSIEMELAGRAVLAALVGALMMIATVSSIFAIPTIYWSLAALAIGYAGIVRRDASHSLRSTAATRPGSLASRGASAPRGVVSARGQK